jgi:acyl transferase domain-containing protein/3-hydroxymyristoyl/3-hydroxydecanoyl-(acyl carrier protein) dehydratase/1-acyl-sn-glycerol-3-phosphate acyltransferase
LKKFEPIAIIGQGCIFPGCTNPEDLWQMVYDNKVNITSADPDSWRVPMQDVIIPYGETETKSRSWNNRGGYVKGFDALFNESSFELDKDQIKGLDPVFKWSFYAAQQALKDAGYSTSKTLNKTGLIMGNLSYPTRSFSKYFEETQLNKLFPEWQNPNQPTDPTNRFMSGLPAILTAKAIGIKGEAFSIDAACASSLYALKLGYDKLVSGESDMMVIGGVCASDQLFLHVGFTALKALSPTGQSRPFNKEADGLIPSEGAGFIVIKKLKDAIASKDNILGVIRGIGLSNDGKQGGFLSPALSGQTRSMHQALSHSAIKPEQVSYIECHATGTTTGDSIELKSMQEVYGKTSAIHLGSLKGNIGHSITASGIGSIIKVLAAMKYKTLPPTPNALPLNESFNSAAFSVENRPKHWKSKNNRIAGISNFGFGGNNAHVLLEEWNPKTKYNLDDAKGKLNKIAVVGVEIQTDTLSNSNEFLKHLLGEEIGDIKRESVAFNAKKLSSPPSDLKYALGQQLLILKTAENLVNKGIKLSEDTGVFIGMGADAEINRYGFRKRLKELLKEGGVDTELYKIEAIEESVCPILNAPGVLGTMPNIPANRINHHFGYNGIGFTVSCEELSGVKALEIAINAIQAGELKSALVGAVDLSDELVNQTALSEAIKMNLKMSNTAVILALKSYDEAVKDNDDILATLGLNEESKNDSYSIPKEWIFNKVGYSHTSSELLKVATGVLLANHRLQLDKDTDTLKPILENRDGFTFEFNLSSQFGGKNKVNVVSEPLKNTRTRTSGAENIYCYSSNNKQELIASLKANTTSEKGVFRLAIVSDKENIETQLQLALKLLSLEDLKTGWLSPTIHYRNNQIKGEVAFAFTGAASAYPNMGRTLLQEFPGLISILKPYCSNSAFAGDWVYTENSPKAKLPYYQLAGSSLMCQVHANFTKEILGIKPNAVIGLSSGETNSMYALGVWDDMDNLLSEIYESDLYTSALGVDFDAVKQHWGLDNNETVEWDNWRILAPVKDVETLLAKEAKAYMAIINTDSDCVIGGDKKACERIINAIGTGKCMPLNHDIAIHCSVVEPFEKEWRKLHTRKVNDVKGIRFYSNYLDGVYIPTTETVADALTGQAVNPIDFPKIVKKAYDDGVRIFIEHGPRNSLSLAINEILAGKEIATVAIDRFGQSGVTQALRASAELWCIGVDINLDNLKAKSELNEKDSPLEIDFQLKMSEIINDKKEVHAPKVKLEPTKEIMEKAPQFAVTRRNSRSSKIESNETATQVAMAQTVAEVVAETKISVQQVTSEDTSLKESPAINASVDFTEQPSPSAAKSVLELLKNQHSIMLNAHQTFIQTQLESQKQYVSLVQNMSNHMMESINDFDRPTEEQFIEMPQSVQVEFNTQIEEEPMVAPLVKNISEEQVETKPVNQSTNSNTVVKQPVSEIIEEKLANKKTELPGPKFSRQELEVLSSGKISSILGPLFEQQDKYDIQVRMPEPPLLLCDRVTGIDAEPGTLGLGTIYTETDVKADSWYLHNNRMPPGIFIEAGQADLLLISYLGIDFQNKGERAYRLLGCELTFHGELPKPGETLKYDIHVDGYAKSGDTTLFFFHYDCHIDGKLRISVRSGQAGFFSVAELLESKGVIWNASEADYTPDYSYTYENATQKSKFSFEEIESYTEGRMVDCFGEQLDWTQTHSRSPRSQGGYQNFIKNITEFDLNGGPAGRGYLKSETIVSPDDWYFKGHFKNDECMPGTLMADACLQMMAFFMVGAGLTAHKDGWRFEPVTDEKMKFICRGQVTPTSKKVTYEIFVDRIVDGDYPVIYAHVLATVDGNKAFLCENSGLRLIPDWPLLTMPHLIEEDVVGKKIANYKGFKFGYESLINCALGNAENAFGPEINYYDGVIRSPRLPGPPYHFMTRIQDYKVEPGNYKNEPYVIAEYDIPENVWYFDENGRATMPYGVLMEVALQPCGWFSTFICQYDIKDKDLVFRNLDGNATQHRDITPADKTIVTKTRLTGVSIMGEIIIVKFDVVSSVDGEEVFTMDTVFGFFDTESMKTQKGLARTDEENANIALTNNYMVPLLLFPKKYFSDSSACLPSSKLLMIDRIAAFYPDGGKYGKGYIKSEKDVRKSEWFFKAHFFQDPVQPGSLGIEAMVQLMQFYMMDQGLHSKFIKPIFEPIAIRDETEWHYRGQVTPDKKLISIDFDVKEIITAETSVSVFGEARLWVDGLKIYHAPRIGMRIREGNASFKKKSNENVTHSSAPYNLNTDEGNEITIGDLNMQLIDAEWFDFTKSTSDFFSDLRSSLTKQFVSKVVFEDHDGIKLLEGKPVLYLANHQTGIESGLFLSMINVFNKVPAKAIAKVEHIESWMGQLLSIGNKKFNNNPPSSFIPFNRDKQTDLLKLLANLAETNKTSPCSLLVHVDGTRSSEANSKVTNVSSALIEFAIAAKMPIVPVRFTCGLPETGTEKLEFPYKFGKQDYYIGKAIKSEELKELSLIERVNLIKEAIRKLADNEADISRIPNDLFEKSVENVQKEFQVSSQHAVIISVLKNKIKLSDETNMILNNLRGTSASETTLLDYKKELLNFLKG